MSADGLHRSQSQSAFHPFVSVAKHGADTFESRGPDTLSCYRMNDNAAPQLWFAPFSMPGSTSPQFTYPEYRQHQSTIVTAASSAPFSTTASEPININTVAKCVAIANETNAAFRASQGLLGASYADYIKNPSFTLSKFWGAENSLQYISSPSSQSVLGSMQPPSFTLAAQQAQSAVAESLVRRHAYYHRRHHPQSGKDSNAFINANELKNKNRFSATGASGKTTVVRDSKMSLSSTPPSPNAGTVGGSLGSSFGPSNFNHASISSSTLPLMHYAANVAESCAQTHLLTPKKVSYMSTSSTLSSFSSSSMSSTHSLTGVYPRKRRADEEDAQYQCCKCSDASTCHTCSTSDVTARVDHVRLCDRNSRGSISPIQHIIRHPDKSDQNPHKRSKNDNEEDDDVIFVSLKPAPGLPRQKLNAPAPLTSYQRTSKTAVKSKRASHRPNSRPIYDSTSSISPVSFAVPSVFACHQQTQRQTPSYAPSSVSAGDQPSPSTAVAVTEQPKGYFLRSSVNGRTIKKLELDDKDNCACASDRMTNNQYHVHGDDKPTKYHTRSQQKKKEVVTPVSSCSPRASESSVSTSSWSWKTPDQQTQNSQGTNENASEKSAKAQMLGGGIQVPPRSSQTVPSSLSEQRSSRTFKKKYEIQGMIGVGGGGSVYAGTRKADNVQVAIKQVPKAKVKRWGKLDGRVVPIEFELLHRASYTGNKGVIRMLDWYERRNSYILIMERPQPVIDLFDYLNQHGALPEKVAKNIFTQIIHAVRHCHANGVVHRDIKDENIILNLHTSEAKLIDFGCGTMLKDAAYTEFAGTPEFYPPEWFTERRYEGKRVDAWSLGVLLYTMIEAEVPFQKEKDIVECKLRFKRAQNTTSSMCRNLISSMLLKDQTKRPTLEEVLQHPWLTGEQKKVANRSSPVVPNATCGEVVNSAASTFEDNLTLIPARSLNSEQQQQPLVLESCYSEQYPCQTRTSFGANAIGHHGIGLGPSVPIGIQSSECIVIS